MKQEIQNSMKLVSLNVDQMKAFVTICKDGIMIHAGVDVKS